MFISSFIPDLAPCCLREAGYKNLWIELPSPSLCSGIIVEGSIGGWGACGSHSSCKEEINGRSRGAPASIPQQPPPPAPSLHTCGASCKRIPPALSGDPPPFYGAAPKACRTVLPDTPLAARDWLTTHLLHAACPLLYCTAVINNYLAHFTGMTVIDASHLNLQIGGGGVTVHALWLLCDSWKVSVFAPAFQRRGVSLRDFIKRQRHSPICLPAPPSRTFQRCCQLWGASSHLTKKNK